MGLEHAQNKRRNGKPAGLWDVLHPGWWELVVGDVDKPSDVLQPRLQPGKTQNPPAGYGLVDTGVDGLHLVASDVKQASDVLGPNPHTAEAAAA